MRFESGASFAGYTVVSQLGRGGMATVYLVREAGINRLVALKVLPEHLAEDAQFAERFEQEAQVVGGLDHPAIIPLYRFGITDNIAWMALRYADAGDFASRISERAVLVPEGLSILRGIGSALDYAHRKGIIHRDLKPQNILMSADGSAYLADFGIAKLLEGVGRLKTTTGGILGTPSYMAPEQAQGLRLGPHTDVYALAVICFQWLAGRLPFDAETPHAILFKHVFEPVPADALSLLAPGVAAVLVRGLAKQPDQRYPTAGAMIAELAQALAPRPSRSSETEVLAVLKATPASASPASGLSDEIERPAVLYVCAKAREIMGLDDALARHGWRALAAESVGGVAAITRGHSLVAVVVDVALLADLGEIVNALDQCRSAGPTPPLLLVSQEPATADPLSGLGSADGYLCEADATSVVKTLEALQRTASAAEPLRVLIVDDDRSQLVFCETVLRRRGMATRTASSSREALAVVESFRPDLVLVDLYMPEGDGMTLTARLRELPGTMLLPIIFLSGEQDVSRRVRAMNVGADDFLTKPVRPAHLIEVVASRAKRARALNQKMQQSAALLTPAPSTLQPVENPQYNPTRFRPKLVAFVRRVTVLLAVLAIAAYGYWKLVMLPAVPRTLAVLPLVNFSPDPADKLFADGLHDELLTEFSRLHGVEVISGTTMRTFKNSKRTLAEIADQLDATHVLEGSVRRDTTGVRLTVQLIDAATDKRVWEKGYEQSPNEALLTDAVANDLAGELGIGIDAAPVLVPAPIMPAAEPTSEDATTAPSE